MRSVTWGALGAALFVGMGLVNTASATIVDFGTSAGNLAAHSEDGYTFAHARLVDGNCLDGACLALNTNETTTLTFGGLAFTLEGFSFKLLGRPAELTVTGNNGASAVFNTGENGSKSYVTAELGALFTGVTSILFADTGAGNFRIDNVVLSADIVPSADVVAPVPLPATGLMLLSGLGVLTVARKRAA
jgi:hypothetical protein